MKTSINSAVVLIEIILSWERRPAAILNLLQGLCHPCKSLISRRAMFEIATVGATNGTRCSFFRQQPSRLARRIGRFYVKSVSFLPVNPRTFFIL